MGNDEFEIIRFTTNLAECNRVPAAVTYRSILRTFSSWLKTIKKNFDTFSYDDVDRYVSNLSNANTANMFLAAIKNYMDFRARNIPFTDPEYLKETHRRDQLKGLRNRPRRSKREKVALDPDEVKVLLEKILALPKTKTNTVLYSGTLVHFYFGARPIELGAGYRRKELRTLLRINWKDGTMELWTAKVNFYRHLAWNNKLTPHLKVWHDAVRAPAMFSDPDEWLTRHLKRFNINGVKITAKTARKTLQTQMRVDGVNDVLIDSILGHISRRLSIGDTYTDFTKFNAQIDDLMKNKHYMVTEGIVTDTGTGRVGIQYFIDGYYIWGEFDDKGELSTGAVTCCPNHSIMDECEFDCRHCPYTEKYVEEQLLIDYEEKMYKIA